MLAVAANSAAADFSKPIMLTVPEAVSGREGISNVCICPCMLSTVPAADETSTVLARLPFAVLFGGLFTIKLGVLIVATCTLLCLAAATPDILLYTMPPKSPEVETGSDI